MGTAVVGTQAYCCPVPLLPGAACRGGDIGLFFSDDPARVVQAIEVCGRCPDRQTCLVRAREEGHREVLRAAVRRQQRQQMRKEA